MKTLTMITNEVLDELLSGVANAADLLGEQGLMKELKVRLERFHFLLRHPASLFAFKRSKRRRISDSK